jgi:hypothetical protein
MRTVVCESAPKCHVDSTPDSKTIYDSLSRFASFSSRRNAELQRQAVLFKCDRNLTRYAIEKLDIEIGKALLSLTQTV